MSRALFFHSLFVHLRHFRRNALYATLNTLGLAIGFAAVTLIGIYLHYESNFEHFHSRRDRIYRVTYRFTGDDGFVSHFARVPAPYVNQLPDAFPDIEAQVRFQNFEQKYVRIGDQKFRPEHAYVTDANVFDVFDFPLLRGHSATALVEPRTVVLSASLARTYFGTADVVGQELAMVGSWNPEETTYTVKGVMEDLPSDTHLPVDMLISFQDSTERAGWAYVYTLLHRDADIRAIDAQLPEFFRQHAPAQESGNVSFVFQHLPDIHLHSNVAREIVPNGNALYVQIFWWVGGFILLIALINFVNLSSALSLGRAKEMGVRTVLGAGRRQVLLDSLTEAMGYNLLGAILGGLLAWRLFPAFQALTGAEFLMHGGLLVGGLVGIAVGSGLLAGLYPAWMLASFRSVDIIKLGKVRPGRRQGAFQVKRVMVTVQFIASILLIGSAFVAYRQFQFLQEKNLGLTKEQIIAMPNLPDHVTSGYPAFKEAIASQPGVLGVTACMEVPSREIRDVGSLVVHGTDPATAPAFDIQVIAPGFTDVLEVTLLAGEDRTHEAPFEPVPAFTAENPVEQYLRTRPRTYLINETGMRLLGWQTPDEALGQQIYWSNGAYQLAPGPITGVVKDFNQETLKNKVDPTVLVFEPLWLRTFLIKVETQNLPRTLAALQDVWDQQFPTYPMEYHFLDDLYEALYKGERIQVQLLYVFSGLALFIAFLGLFSLIAYSLRTRTKELAIRRILGADMAALIRLISREYLWVLLVGGIVAVPLSYWAVRRWLENFAYRIDMPLFPYVLTLALIAALLLATVTLQTLRSVATNPTESLREE
ncbi:putative ABC transport system permease protein [Catalinimonas alkaloidigena]|uniref:Putative ABC transport system permease protein n=1 Tax=Catalinimonas alkaloidigena TaxID=1075417 RepID=A0A1G9UD57_9BACT|nr:ABC transporter permease [Catalinimonas alkaloidigena]SDM57856.1 putative ABC transport system permease protein [Catalinimonas alkaloidigena]